MEKQITYDFGARQYSPLVPWWDRMDKMCEKHYELSPYLICGNNPVNRIEKDGKDWYYTKFGDFLYSDFKSTDNIIIREINARAIGNAPWQKGQPKYIDRNIKDIELDADAYSRIFSDILNRSGFDLSVLKSKKIEVYKTDGINFNGNKTSQAESSANANATTTHYKNNQVNITAFINTSYDGTQEIFSTISNVVSILGGHEYLGHYILKGDEKTAYNVQKNLPSWKGITYKLKKHINDELKKYY